jgi:hypothetical protein
MKTKEVDPNVRYLLEDYTEKLVELIEQRTVSRLQDLAQSITGLRPSPARTSLPAANGSPAPPKSRRRTSPRVCPVPGCKNPPAPFYGMVCREHKDVPKAQIQKYREARKSGIALPEVAPAKPKGKRPAIPVSRD